MPASFGKAERFKLFIAEVRRGDRDASFLPSRPEQFPAVASACAKAGRLRGGIAEPERPNRRWVALPVTQCRENSRIDPGRPDQGDAECGASNPRPAAADSEIPSP